MEEEERGRARRGRRVVAFTGVAALVAVGLHFVISAVKNRRNAANGGTSKRKISDLPGFKVQVNLSASQIHALADSIILKSKETHDFVASIPISKVAFTNAISPLANLEADLFPFVQSCVFLKMVSVSDEIRQASSDAEKKLDSHFLTCRKREDVYHVVKAFRDRGEWVNPEAQRFVNHLVKDFERNGVTLNSNKRIELDNIRSKIDDLSLKFIKNLAMDDSFILLNESDLVGMPPEFIKSLEAGENGKLKISLRSHVSSILEHCTVGSARRAVAVAQGQRCGKENMGILEKLIQLRHKMADLLGYSCYADYAIEPRMAGTSARVIGFLEDVSNSLTDLATRELNTLKDLKRKEEGDSPFGMEDLRYYIRRFEEEKISVDFGTIKEFFPLNLVLSGILKIFQDLFALRFLEILNVDSWHESVRLFSVTDLTSNELLGYFFLDLFSREGKYSQMCVLSLQDGCTSSNGMQQTPVALLISQFPKQVSDEPVLLGFNEVLNFFHEFSHVVHHICNQATFSRFSGIRMEADFLEIPSLMLEKWCYEPIPLNQISGFYQDISKSIKDELRDSLKWRRDSFAGIKLKQEILLCLLDQIIHSREHTDINELLKNLHPKVLMGIPLLEGSNPAACFPRFAIGYEATCYSYLWSEVFAKDIYASKFKDNLTDSKAGLQFRNKVLALGGSRDPLEIIREYLGREPSILPFIQGKMRNTIL